MSRNLRSLSTRTKHSLCQPEYEIPMNTEKLFYVRHWKRWTGSEGYSSFTTFSGNKMLGNARKKSTYCVRSRAQILHLHIGIWVWCSLAFNRTTNSILKLLAQQKIDEAGREQGKWHIDKHSPSHIRTVSILLKQPPAWSEVRYSIKHIAATE